MTRVLHLAHTGTFSDSHRACYHQSLSFSLSSALQRPQPECIPHFSNLFSWPCLWGDGNTFVLPTLRSSNVSSNSSRYIHTLRSSKLQQIHFRHYLSSLQMSKCFRINSSKRSRSVFTCIVFVVAVRKCLLFHIILKSTFSLLQTPFIEVYKPPSILYWMYLWCFANTYMWDNICMIL